MKCRVRSSTLGTPTCLSVSANYSGWRGEVEEGNSKEIAERSFLT